MRSGAPEKRSVLYVNLAVLLFGFAGLFARWVGLPALGITFGRVFFSSISLLIYLLVKRQPLRLESRKDAAMLVLTGAILALHWWAFFASVQMSTVAVGTITFSSFPLFVTFLEPLFFKEKLKLRNVLLALVILTGVFITVPEFSLANDYVRGIVLGMISAIGYAFLTLANRSFAGRYVGSVITFYEQAVACVLLLPLVLRAGLVLQVRDITLLALMGIVMTAFAHTLFNNSLRYISAQLAGILSSMETVYGILLAMIILGEAPSVREILGAVIIVSTVVYAQIRAVE